jgi:hypothetical protein
VYEHIFITFEKEKEINEIAKDLKFTARNLELLNECNQHFYLTSNIVRIIPILNNI